MALEKFWAPVPWMLEAPGILQGVFGCFTEAGIVAGLLPFNAVPGVLQQSRARATLAASKSRLAMSASVPRDGTWTIIPAADPVKCDVVKLSIGRVMAADIRIVSGDALLDHSMRAGESVPDRYRGLDGAGCGQIRGPAWCSLKRASTASSRQSGKGA